MNRTSLAALAAAAVIGTTGGVTVALNAAGDDGGEPTADKSSSAATPKPDKSSDSSGKSTATPLYYADGAIHDGSKNVAVPTEVASGEVRDLAAVDGGWLVVQADTDSSGDEYFTGTYVAEDGGAWRIGEWRGNWDITAERDKVVYSSGVTWHAATFADRSTEPLDVLAGAGKEPSYMDVVNSLNGVAIAQDGLITAWKDGDTNRLVVTEEDQWTHQPWGPSKPLPGPVLPGVLTSPDGTEAVVPYGNVDYRPENPVGDCLAGGPVDDVDAWWKECQIGEASPEPWSPSGDRLLIRGTSADGPGTSWVRVIDPVTGKKVSEFDPTGLLWGAQWGDDDTVFTLAYDEQTEGLLIKRCDVAAETCTLEKRLGDHAVLGSR